MLTIATLLLVTSCGGSDGDDFPDYSGTWSAFVDLADNSCPRTIPDEFLSIAEQHLVSQDEDLISIFNGAETFNGNLLETIDGFTSFYGNGPSHILPGFLGGYDCTEALVWQYEDIDDSFDGVYNANFVTRFSSITCLEINGDDQIDCNVTYVGSAFQL